MCASGFAAGAFGTMTLQVTAVGAPAYDPTPSRLLQHPAPVPWHCLMCLRKHEPECSFSNGDLSDPAEGSLSPHPAPSSRDPAAQSANLQSAECLSNEDSIGDVTGRLSAQGYLLRYSPNAYLAALALVAAPNLAGHLAGPTLTALGLWSASRDPNKAASDAQAGPDGGYPNDGGNPLGPAAA